MTARARLSSRSWQWRKAVQVWTNNSQKLIRAQDQASYGRSFDMIVHALSEEKSVVLSSVIEA